MDDMLELTRFIHCPSCASRDIAVHQTKAFRCRACNFEYYHNAAAAVAGIVESDGRILLVRREREPRKGYWGLPGGFADYRESLEQALLREIEEEVGLRVQVTAYLASFSNEYHYKGVTYFSTDAYFVCRAADLSAAIAREEIAEVTVVHPREIDFETLAFDSFRRAIECYLQHSP
jgi:NAD+ diphosphatase